MTREHSQAQPVARPWATIIAAIALFFTLGGFAFTAGVQSDQISQNTKDNEAQEERLDELVPAVGKIERSVEFLVRAEEERRQMERERR